jgi:azurin
MIRAFPIFFILFLWSVLLAAKPDEKSRAEAPKQAKPVTVNIAMRDGLRFDPPRFSANPGAELVISLQNLDSTDQVHNFVLVKPGRGQEIVNQALLLGDKGPALGYVPASPDVLFQSELVGPEKKTALRITMPKVAGIYPYVCTFPGHGLVMYGAAYVGVPMPALGKDTNVPSTASQSYIAGNGRRPFVQRIFMPESGPAAIAIALPGELNACWDAGQCRLRYVWSGTFIDATKHWAGNGRDLPVLGGKSWWTAPEEQFPIRIGDKKAPAPKVKFLGYKLEKGFPVFRYTVEGTEVHEKLSTTDQNKAILVSYKVQDASKTVFYEGVAKDKEFSITLTPPAK